MRYQRNTLLAGIAALARVGAVARVRAVARPARAPAGPRKRGITLLRSVPVAIPQDAYPPPTQSEQPMPR